jgi:hypothetical protein
MIVHHYQSQPSYYQAVICDGRVCLYGKCNAQCFIAGWREMLTKALDYPALVHSRGRFHEALAEIERLDAARKQGD